VGDAQNREGLTSHGMAPWGIQISVKMKGKQDMNGKYWYLRVDGSEISNNRLGCIKPCK